MAERHSFYSIGILYFLLILTGHGCNPISIDGEFSDWQNQESFIKQDSFVREFKLTDDEKYLYGYLEVTDSISIQSFNGSIHINLVSGKDSLELIFSRQDNLVTRTFINTGFGSGSGYRTGPGSCLKSSYDLGLVVLPTHHSDKFEFRLEKNNCDVIFKNNEIDVRVSELRNDSLSAGEFFNYKLKNNYIQPFSQDLAKNPGDVRVMTWNVMDEKFRNLEVAAKVIKAVNPDILLLEEVYQATVEEDLKGVIFPENWSVYISKNGRRKIVMASRFEQADVPSLTSIEYPSENITSLISEQPVGSQWMDENKKEGLTSSGSIVRIGDREILFVLLGLTCCGHDGSWEDSMRILEASLLSANIRSVLNNKNYPVLISGDFNLVGSLTPLRALQQVKEPYLREEYLLQHSDRAAYTWRALKSSPFGPGKLDYVLVDQALDTKSIIVKLEEILTEDELMKSSDHYPIITDIRNLK